MIESARVPSEIESERHEDEMKKSGFIQQAIERANLKGAVVPK